MALDVCSLKMSSKKAPTWALSQWDSNQQPRRARLRVHIQASQPLICPPPRKTPAPGNRTPNRLLDDQFSCTEDSTLIVGTELVTLLLQNV